MSKKGFELSINFIVIMILAIVIFGLGIKFVNDFFKQANKLSDKSTEQLDREIGELLCPTNQMVCIPVNRKTIRHGEFDTFGIKIRNVLDKSADFKVAIYPDNTVAKTNDVFEFTPSNPEDIKRLGFTTKEVGGLEEDVPLVLRNSRTCDSNDRCVATDKLFLLPEFREINNLGINQETSFAIGVEVGKGGIEPGTYVFDVYIVPNEESTVDPSFSVTCGSAAVFGYSGFSASDDFDYDCVYDLTSDTSCTNPPNHECFSKSDLYGSRIYKLYVEIP